MIRKIFTAPYPWLPAAIFAFFLFCFALHPLSPFYTHRLADPDDYMRLNEVVSWLRGQSWYDLSVPRLSPGAHTIVHWSRLVDLPIALIALPFISFLGITNAVFVAALIVPLIWFTILLTLLPALAGPLIGKDRSNLTCVMVLFAPMLLFNYTPGRVDHHGIQAIIAGFALICVGRMILNDKGTLYAALAAAAFACGFWIGAEALPWAIMFITCLSIAAAWQGKIIARNAALFGICLPVFTALLIPIALPAAEFSSRALSWFSPAYVLFAALAGSVLIVGWFLGRYTENRFVRLALYAILGLIAGTIFFILIPSALQGPFADYDTFDATIALDNISESQPLIRSLHFNRFMPMTVIPVIVTFVRVLVLPLLAFAVCSWEAKRTRGPVRLIWLTQAVFLAAATALTVFWQIRVGLFMELFALAPLTKLLCASLEALRWRLWDRKLFWAEISIFLFLGFFPVVLLPALIAKTPIYPDIALFPAARSAAACPMESVLATLNDTTLVGNKPVTIMNTSDTGPEILFTTQHRVVSGNFDVPGNADTFTFFHATDDTQALATAHLWHADLVLLCQRAPLIYVGKDYYALSHLRLQTGQDGLLHLANTDAAQPLIERLIRGEIPSWLKAIEIYSPSDYHLFRIIYPAGQK